MARYHGKVGYVTQVETAPGVVVEKPLHEQAYFGDVIRNTRRIKDGAYLNDDLVSNNMFSLVADQYAYDHFFDIRYLRWAGVAWKVSSVEVQRPRLILTIQGVYNGETYSPPDTP